MDSRVVALVLASAFLHASWNAVLKRQPDPEGAALALLAVATAAAGAAVPLAPGVAFPSAGGLGWALAAGFCEGGYFVTLALGFRAAPFGLVYAVSRGGALALIWPVSALWLGEAVTPGGIAGVATVASGLALLAVERVRGVPARGLGWAVLCAGFVAAYHVCYKCALATGAEATAVLATAFAVALPIGLARLGRGGWARVSAALRGHPLALGAAGLVCTASFLLFLSALALGGAGAAATLRNTSVLFALLLAWGLGERPAPRQLAGMIAIAAGAALMGWPR